MTDVSVTILPKHRITREQQLIIYSALEAYTGQGGLSGREQKFIIPRSAPQAILLETTPPQKEKSGDGIGTVKPGPMLRDRGLRLQTVLILTRDFSVLVDQEGTVWRVPDGVDL